MAKKIKFPLTMKNNFQVRTIEELREHFDLDKAIEYFLDGKLLAWLEARYYEQESIAIRELGKDEAQLHQKLCNILGVEYDKAEIGTIDVEAIAERNRKLNELKQYTSDASILEKVDQVAFNQEDLASLIDEGIHNIYLCNNVFSIPLRVENMCYIGIGKSIATILSRTEVDFSERKIEFINIEFDDAYAQLLISKRVQAQKDEGMVAENKNSPMDDAKAMAKYTRADGLFQASQSMLAQANQTSSSVLSLLQ